MAFTKPFADLSKEDAPIAGGKGASLGEMINSGIPVPDGFVVLADTFDTFLKETDLIQEIDTILDSVNHEVIHTVEAASESIQALILSRPMPQEMQAEIQAKFQDLGSQYVAVRSSATAEDGADHAWAGQLDSYLNTTEVDLIEKVRKCWASLFTPRAIFYRFEKGLHTTKISVAVVVQKMVDSEKSGIAFSVHPVTEDYNQLIIEAGFGLGEAIVSGAVTPDSYVVEKEPRNILDINVSHQGRALYRVEGGGNEWRDLSEAAGNSQVLDEAQIQELSDIILTIEKHYGFPCDIEWAYEDGKFYIVQSRPITTLTQHSGSVGEQPESISKTASLSKSGDSSFLKEEELDIVEDWWEVGRWFQPPFANMFFSHWHTTEAVKKITGLALHSSFAVNHYSFQRESDKEAILAFLEGQYQKKCLGLLTQRLDQYGRELFTKLEKDLGRGGEYVEEKIEEIFHSYTNLAGFWAISVYMGDLLTTVGKTHGYIKTDSELFAKVHPHLRTSWIEKEADTVIDIAKKLLKKYGNFDSADIPRLIGKDEELKTAVARYVNEYIWVGINKWVGDPIDKEYAFKRITEEIENSRQGNHVETKRFSGDESQLEGIVQLSLAAAYWRAEGARMESIMALAVRGLMESLAKKNRVTYQDILMLLPSELISLVKSSTQKIENIHLLQRRHKEYFSIVSKQGEEVIFDSSDSKYTFIKSVFVKEVNESVRSKALTGIAASSGFITGAVRLIENRDQFADFEKGEILVAAETSPIFVPLMRLASAIITGKGGITSHAAIVSRELNKPCIIGVKDVTKILRTGDLVEVDADNGVVRILERSDEKNSLSLSPIDYQKYGRWVAPTIEVELWLDWSHTPEAEALGVPYNPNPDVLSFDGHFFVRNTGAYPFIKDRVLEEFKLGKTDYADTLLQVAQDLVDECTKRAAQVGSHNTIENWEKDFDLMRRLRFPWWACFAISDPADIIIAEYAKNHKVSVDDISAALPQLPSTLTRDQQKLVSFKEEIEREGIKCDFENIKKKNTDLAQRVEAYQKETEYLGTHHFWGDPRLMPTFMEALAKVDPLENHEAGHVFDEINHVLRTAGKGAQLRLECAQSGARLAYAWRPFLTQLANRIGLSYEEIIFLTVAEIKEANASGHIDISMVRERTKKAGLYKTDEESKVLWGEELEIYLKEFVPQEDFGEVTEIKGNVANKGKAQGIVAIVLTPKDAERVRTGMILVAPETTPDFIPAMAKAAGFVTDLGGITSHAAIVARELKKPCIIGTKIATQVLKDGDLVEVDAENGLVRVLERSDSALSVTPENSVFTFGSIGTTFIVEDIVSRCYIQWECMKVCKGDNVRVFVKKDEVKRMHAEGAKMTKKFLEEKVQKMQEQNEYIEQNKELLKTKIAFTLPELQEFFRPLEEICDSYSFFDIHYTDGMVKEDGFSEAGEYVQSVKNILRDVLSSPFFEEGGWLSIGLGILSKQFSVPVETLKWYTKKELLDLFEGKFVEDQLLASRQESNVQYKGSNGQIIRVVGKGALKYWEDFSDDSAEEGNIHGTVAHRGAGSVQGRVRIIKKDFSYPSLLGKTTEAMQKGDILVTDTTDPDFLPAMQKAGAIVTDIGGLLSHASITSRELNKLCVIATVSASKILKDGNLVEVDADTGLIRIVERNS